MKKCCNPYCKGKVRKEFSTSMVMSCSIRCYQITQAIKQISEFVEQKLLPEPMFIDSKGPVELQYQGKEQEA